MSLRLIGNYGTDSDSSISDSDEDCFTSQIEAETREDASTVTRSSDTHLEEDEASSVCVDPLSLGLEDLESSDSEPNDSDSETGSPSPPPNCFQATVTPLPLPNMDRVIVGTNPSYSKSEQVSNLVSMEKGMGEEAVENSVFFNPFKKAEEDRLAILKRHVDEFDIKPKVTEDPAYSGEMRGGRRRRGFSRSHHRVAIPPPLSYARRGKSGSGAGETHSNSYPMPAAVHHFSSGGPFEGTVAASGSHPHHQQYCHSPPNEEEEDLVQKPCKHRSGVTDSLIPPKKFMKMHEKIQAKERPWSLK